MALYQNDGQLAALYRQRVRLESELRPASTAAGAPQAAAATQDQVESAQSEVDTATKRVAEAQAEVASKAERLTEEHPDMRASRGRAAQAAADLAQARNKLAALKARQGSPSSGTAPDDANSELKAKLAEINVQIRNREAELKRTAGGAPVGPSPAPSASQAPVPEVSLFVALETEWQRLVRAVSEARSRHDEVRKRYEVVRLALQSAPAADQPLMVIEPAYRPTRAFKGGRTQVALGGYFVALLLGLLYVVARVAFDDTEASPVGPSSVAIASLVLSLVSFMVWGITAPLVSFMVCGITAPIGLVLGVRELVAIKRGASSPAGRNHALGGAIVGGIVMIFWLVVALGSP
jgi:hypothetical protein